MAKIITTLPGSNGSNVVSDPLKLDKSTYTGNAQDLDNRLDILESGVPSSYAKIVYVNGTTPNTATIFDLNTPPVTNDDLLKLDTNNLYIGTDASTWLYNGIIYITKLIPNSSNFFINGSTADAGAGKTSNIYRTGTITAPSFIKTGGVSTEFLKADGSVDSTVYTGDQDLQSVLNNGNYAISLDNNSEVALMENAETYFYVSDGISNFGNINISADNTSLTGATSNNSSQIAVDLGKINISQSENTIGTTHLSFEDPTVETFIKIPAKVATGTYTLATTSDIPTPIDISGKEDTANKQNSLAVDGTGVKYVTVDAVNSGVAKIDATKKIITSQINNTDGNLGQILTKNLIDTATFTAGVFIDWTNGNTSANASYSSTDFLNVIEGQNYRYIQKTGGTGSIYGAWYTATGVYLSAIQTTGNDVVLIAPAKAFKVRISYSNITNINNFFFYPVIKFTSYGDSITDQNQWQPLLSQYLGLFHTKAGFAGYPISGSGTSSLNNDLQINTLPIDSEIVTILGGTNDWAQNYVLGTENSLVLTEFYGALNTTIKKIKVRCPNAVIVVLATTYGEAPGRAGFSAPKGEVNAIGLKTTDYASAAIVAAKNNNVKFIRTDNIWDTNNITDFVTYDGYYLHPNSVGGELMASKISLDLVQIVNDIKTKIAPYGVLTGSNAFFKINNLTDATPSYFATNNSELSIAYNRNPITGLVQNSVKPTGYFKLVGSSNSSFSINLTNTSGNQNPPEIARFNGAGRFLLGTTTDDTVNIAQFNGSTKTTALTLSTAPATSASTYDILTRNSSTGVVEKVASSSALLWTDTAGTIRNNNSGEVELKPSTKVSILNAANAETAKITSTGGFISNTTSTGFFGVDGASGMYFDGSKLNFRNYGDSVFRFNPIYLNWTDGRTQDVIGFSNSTINPTSGTAIFNMLNISPTVNQTGGANGITRSLYINPTLTAAADFRAIEVTGGKVIIPNGSTSNEAINKGQLDLKQDTLTLTTTGTSGVATLVGSTLNIPNYATGGGGATNLTYTPSATDGIVNSDTGTDATLTLATGINAGLLSPSDFTKLSNTSGTNTGDNSVNTLYTFDYRAANFVAGTNYQEPIILTTTGTSGVSTFIGNTLNIPSYSGGSGYTFTNTSNLTATGTNQGTALALTSKINTIAVTGAGTGVILPSATINDFITVVNHGVNALLVYPATGETVEGGAINIPFTLFQGQSYRAGCNTTGAWEGVDLNVYDDEHQTLVLNSVLVEPPTPITNSGLLYGKYIAGKFTAKIKGASGLDTPLQNAFWQNNICMWNPTTATAGVWLGTAGAGAGTYSTALPTTTSKYTTIKRGRWANIVTTVNQVLGQRNTEAMFFRGAVAGQGGFFFYARLGFDVWTNGSRFFGGMHSATTVVSADPSALNNTIGFCIDAADNGAISFLTRGTAATKASTGFTAVTGKGYDIFIFCASNSTQYSWRIIDINAGTEASGVATATLPTNTTMLTAGVLASNAALTPVTSIQLGVNRIYVETDF